MDVLTEPASNPWLCQMRLTGLDFLPDGKKAVRLHMGRGCVGG